MGIENIENEEIEIGKMLKQIKIHVKAIIVITIISMMLGYGYTITRTKMYVSKATMAVMYAGSENESQSGKYVFSANIVDTYVLFLSENVVLDKVSKKTGYSTGTIKNHLRVKSDNLIITLSYTDSNPKNAKIILDTIMDTAIKTANTKNKDGKPTYMLLSDGLKIFSKASKASPVSVLKKNMLVSFVVGIAISFGYILLSWLFDRKYKDVEEIEEDLDLPVFTAVPYYTFEERKRKRK